MEKCLRCSTPLPEGSHFCLSCGADVSGETGSPSLPPHRPDLGTDLDAVLRADVKEQFLVDREIGRGGMGAVFLATEAQLGRKVAIKVLPPELTFSAAAVERFKREARTAATLDHPHIIPIYRVSSGESVFWFAMKYVEGESLAAMIAREQPVSLQKTADIVAQVAEALDYAHGHGVIHRDVKPSNIIMDARGWVTVMDFGIAKAIGAESITGSGSMIGTPYYMSAEQCLGKTVTAASDQYSLGVVAYEMLSGRLPFSSPSVIEVVRQHCSDPVPSLRSSRPEVSASLEAVVERALAKKPEERFASVREFAEAFTRAARGESVNVGGPAARIARRRRNLAVGGVGVLVVAALGVVLWPSRTRQHQAAAPPTGESARDTSAARPGGERGPAQTARLTLRGVPAGATVAVDTQRWRGAPSGPVVLAPGVQHAVTVSATGFAPWRRSITAQPGEQVTLQVPPLRAETAAPPVAAAEPAAFGTISVGSRPASLISIAGAPARLSPIWDQRVAAGNVRLIFTVTDSTGASWTWDTTVTVVAGESKRLGMLRLVRR